MLLESVPQKRVAPQPPGHVLLEDLRHLSGPDHVVLIGGAVHGLPGEDAVFQDQVAPHAVALGDGGGAGVDIVPPLVPVGCGHVEVPIEQDRPLRHWRYVLLVPEVAVGGVEGEALPLQQGVVRQHGELQYHLVHLAVAVAPHGDDLILDPVEQPRRCHAVVLHGEGIPGTVVEQVPQQQQLLRLFDPEGVQQLLGVEGGPVQVRGDHELHRWSPPCQAMVWIVYTNFS